MEPVTISSKYQVVIPREIREQFDLKPGQKIVFFPHKKTLRVIIVPPIEDAEGFLEGIDTNIEREEDDRV